MLFMHFLTKHLVYLIKLSKQLKLVVQFEVRWCVKLREITCVQSKLRDDVTYCEQHQAKARPMFGPEKESERVAATVCFSWGCPEKYTLKLLVNTWGIFIFWLFDRHWVYSVSLKTTVESIQHLAQDYHQPLFKPPPPEQQWSTFSLCNEKGL